jgi:hypothetical protein
MGNPEWGAPSLMPRRASFDERRQRAAHQASRPPPRAEPKRAGVPQRTAAREASGQDARLAGRGSATIAVAASANSTAKQ